MASRRPSSSRPRPSPRDPDVTAYVGLRNPTGVSVASAPPSMLSAQNIQQMIATPQTREGARRWLESQGFNVERVSPMNIVVTAPRRRFEEVFGAPLAPAGAAAGSSPKRPPAAARVRGKSRPAPAASYWDWAAAPTIPSEAKDLIDSVILPQPAQLL